MFLAPGLFALAPVYPLGGLGRLADAIEAEFEGAGEKVKTFVAEAPPRTSIAVRATSLAAWIESSAGMDDHIHLVGHSTGGLDLRMVASPSATQSVRRGARRWLPRLRTVTTLGTPHFGTPLAAFMEEHGALLTYEALTVAMHLTATEQPPGVSALGALVSLAMNHGAQDTGRTRMLRRIARSLGFWLGHSQRAELAGHLASLKLDPLVVRQLTPDAMAAFGTRIDDRPGVHYQCAVAVAEGPPNLRIVDAVFRPEHAGLAALLHTFHDVCARNASTHACRPRELSAQQVRAFMQAFGMPPPPGSSDGVVPTYSQLWGHLAWAGHGTHLDLAGQRLPDVPRGTQGRTGVSEQRFDALVASIAKGMIEPAGPSATHR